jgi:hypothetical protein
METNPLAEMIGALARSLGLVPDKGGELIQLPGTGERIAVTVPVATAGRLYKGEIVIRERGKPYYRPNVSDDLGISLGAGVSIVRQAVKVSDARAIVSALTLLFPGCAIRMVAAGVWVDRDTKETIYTGKGAVCRNLFANGKHVSLDLGDRFPIASMAKDKASLTITATL